MARPERTGSRRGRWAVGLLLVLVAVGLFVGWADRSTVDVVSIGSADRLVVVNTAGPITVVAGAQSTVTSHASWMLRAPTIETASDDSGMVVRVSCPGLTPCRSSVEVEIDGEGDGVSDVTVLGDELVTVFGYDGNLTVLSGGGASLGPVSGSSRVVSDGSIDGFGLRVGELHASATDGSVTLGFRDVPELVVVEGQPRSVAVEVPPAPYQVVVDAPGGAESAFESVDDSPRAILVTAVGPVVITSTE